MKYVFTQRIIFPEILLEMYPKCATVSISLQRFIFVQGWKYSKYVSFDSKSIKRSSSDRPIQRILLHLNALSSNPSEMQDVRNQRYRFMISESLREYFTKYGDITEVMVMKDPTTRRSRYGKTYIRKILQHTLKKKKKKKKNTPSYQLRHEFTNEKLFPLFSASLCVAIRVEGASGLLPPIRVFAITYLDASSFIELQDSELRRRLTTDSSDCLLAAAQDVLRSRARVLLSIAETCKAERGPFYSVNALC